jgi:hypothetical protein
LQADAKVMIGRGRELNALSRSSGTSHTALPHMIAERAGSVQQRHTSLATARHPTAVRHAPRALIVLARECERLRVVLSDA